MTNTEFAHSRDELEREDAGTLYAGLMDSVNEDMWKLRSKNILLVYEVFGAISESDHF